MTPVSVTFTSQLAGLGQVNTLFPSSTRVTLQLWSEGGMVKALALGSFCNPQADRVKIPITTSIFIKTTISYG